MSRTYGKAQDLIDFTRASSGTALRRVKYGAELVTNGTFDSDTTGWSGGGGALPTLSAVSGQLVAEATTTGSLVIDQTSMDFEAGKLYQIKVDLIETATSINVYNFIGSSLTIGALSVGTNVINYIASADGFLRIGATGATFPSGEGFTVDNVSVKEVTFDTSDGDLILFNHPNNIPRIEYDANGNLLGLLVEEARTNVMLYSEALASPPWAISSLSVTVVANDKVAPDGNQTATKVSDASNFGGITATSNVGTTIASKSFTISVWVYADTTFTFDLRTRGTGSVQEPQNTTVSTVAGQWVRVSSTHTFTASADGSTMAVFLYTSEFLDVSNSNTIWFWGAQLEQGSFPTSYIPTSGSTATRSADVASLSTSAFGYNSVEGTLFVEMDVYSASVGSNGFVLSDGTLSNRLYIANTGTGAPHLRAFVGGSDQGLTSASPASSITANTMYKMAGAYKENDAAFTRDGFSVGTDSSFNIPSVTTAYIGVGADGNSSMSGHIKSLKYIPRRLTNAQLQELTS